MPRAERIPVLYVAPWVDSGGSDTGTIDWFRHLDRERFAPFLATTQPSDNRRLGEVWPYAEEVWPLPELMAGQDMPGAIFDLIATRGIRVLHVMHARLGFELLPDLASLPEPPVVVAQVHAEEPDGSLYLRMLTARFGNLVDAYAVISEHLAGVLERYDVPRSRIHVIRLGVDADDELSPETDPHGALYERLLAGRPAPAPETRPARAEPVRLPPRPRDGAPLVSVVIPCFNHGRHLPECLASVRAQSWPEIEIVVVDDASTEPETRELLAGVERDDGLTLVRQEVNGGPSRARNAGIAAASGRYVLPVDADDLLFEDAVERLVGQLSQAPADVGYVYPSMQYFGTRRDYFEAPPFNPYWLMFDNYCSVCSLVDRSVYDAGLRYAEDIVLGHEDWDFVLQLAERGIAGEPARGPVLRYRKLGFTRSAVVEHGPASFHDAVAGRHPGLFADPVSIKARHAPGVSLVPLATSEPETGAGRELVRLLRGQTTADVELVAASRGDWPEDDTGPAIRRIDPGETAAATLGAALAVAKGQLTIVSAGSGHALLEDAATVEQIVRMFAARPQLAAIVLADAGASGRHPLRLLQPGEAPGAVPHAVAFRSGAIAGALPDELRLDEDDPVGSIARELSTRRVPDTAWRHLRGGERPARAGAQHTVRMRRPAPRDSGERLERIFLDGRPPGVPTAEKIRRWAHAVSWTPAESSPLCRHRELETDERRVTNDRVPPPGFALEYDLGSVHRFQVPGSAELLARGPRGYERVPDPGDGSPSVPGPRRPETLGFVGEDHLPLLEPLELAFHPPSGQWVLVGGGADNLRDEVTERELLGYVEPFPLLPREPPYAERRIGLVPLLRSVDAGAYRHRVAAGAAPAGEVSLELGVMHEEPQEGSIPIWISGDRVVFESAETAPLRPGRGDALRWAAAPLTWRRPGAGALSTRARNAARRLAARSPATPGTAAPGEAPAGYLWPGPDGDFRQQLFAAVHPVTGDQLVTPWPNEAADLGYGEPAPLGWTARLAPATGSLDPRPVPIPWASRFGVSARRYL